MEFRVLGPVEWINSDGRPVRLDRAQERSLLAVLLCELNSTVSVRRLGELVWDGNPPERAAAIIQTHVSRLRRRLRSQADGCSNADLVTHGKGYSLRLPAECVDLHRFRRQVDQARGLTDPAARAQAFDVALGEWRGTALADATAGSTPHQLAAPLNEERLLATESLAAALLEAGQLDEVVARMSTVVAEHPTRERLVATLMLALFRTGRQAPALELYRSTRTRLVDELGVEPTAELRRLHRSILTQAHEVAAPSHPPPSSRRPRWRGPRSPLTRIIGRDRELTAICQILGDHRLLTIIGMGGIGKTTVAMRAAELMTEDSEVCVVPLENVHDFAQIALAVAETLGVPAAGADGAVAAAVRELGKARTLLVLDNCEHVVDECRRLLRALLSACPDLVVLATSRIRLAMPEETAWQLDPLPVQVAGRASGTDSPAVSLFARRVVECRQRALDDCELVDAHRICVVLDGHPLALELAAARTRTTSISALADRLTTELAEPDAGPSTPLSRALDWSYDLLSTTEKSVLTSLSVFRGGFDLDTAVAVCASGSLKPRAVRVAIGGLTDHSLLLRDPSGGPDRFRMLEVVRHYASAHLHDRRQVATHHLDHWLGVVRRVAGKPLIDDQVRGWVALGPDRHNLRSALDHAIASGRNTSAVELAVLLFDFWLLHRTQVAELFEAMARVGPLMDDCPPDLRYWALTNQVELLTMRDNYSAGIQLLTDRAASIDDPERRISLTMSEVRHRARLLDPAVIGLSRRLYRLERDAPDPHRSMHAAARHAEVLLLWGRYGEALTVCDAVDTSASSAGNLARLLVMRASAELGTSRWDAAGRTVEKLRELLDRPDNFLHPAMVTRTLALHALATQGDRARPLIIDLLEELVERQPVLPKAYAVEILLAEADRRGGAVDVARHRLGAALREGLSGSDYSWLLPGVPVACLLQEAIGGDVVAAHSLKRDYDRCRSRLGLPAPVGFEPCHTELGLEAGTPGRPRADPAYREGELRALVESAMALCVDR